ncbi:MAG TPA: glycosyltransferase family 4 protein [Polyangia bacterium]|nr:glycosyltransferase family 4 protein [Polyangia bacterium]
MAPAPLRVAFVVPGGLDRVSGGFIYDRHVIAAMRALGATVDVVPLAWLPAGAALAANLAPLPPGLDGYDVVIEDELGHRSLLLRHRGLRAAGVRVVALVHNLSCRQPAARWAPAQAVIERAYFRSVDGAVAVCVDTLSELVTLSWHPLPIVVAHAGRDHLTAVAPAEVAARAAAPGPLRILFVASVTPAKGLHHLLDVVASLLAAGHDVTLDIAGALDQAPSYVRVQRARAGLVDLASRVRWHGLLSAPALADVYRRCDVLALPSDREAYPLVAIEALAAGLPVFVTDRGGAGEAVGAGPQGRCLPPDEHAAWVRALALLARDRAALAAAGLAALRRFSTLGTWADAAASVLGLCRRLRDRG